MTYQPYPTGGGSNSNVAQRGPQPSSVRNAVILMYVGAGLSALGLIVTLVRGSALRSSIEKALRTANNKRTTKLTAAQIHTTANDLIIIVIVVALIGIALWLWMAWANGQGKAWARVVASVFFGLDTISLIFLGSRTLTTLIVALVGWLVGLAAIVFLWRRDTTQYIAQSQSQ
jgi:hypothetical protein